MSKTTRRSTVRPAWMAVALLGVLGIGVSSGARAGETTFAGRIYADFTHKSNKDDATGKKSADSGIGTDVKRFYFQVDHEWNDIWSAHFVTDIGDFGTKRYDVFVKKAYLEGAFSKEANLRLGSSDTTWIPFAEGVYRYRYLENTFIDRLKLGNSADWGIHFKGAKGVANYAAAVVNGRGYSDPTRSKRPDFEARLGFKPTEELTFAVGGYSGKLGKDVEGVDTFHTATRFDVLVDYSTDQFRIGGEWGQARNFNTITTQGLTDKADGYSAWFAVPVNDEVEVFGRYDDANLSKDLNPGLEDTYYNAGFQYSPGKNLDFAFAYKYEKVDSGRFGGKVNGVGSSTPNSSGKSNEIGIWTKLRF